MRRLGVLVVGLLLLFACGRRDEGEQPVSPSAPAQPSTAPTSAPVAKSESDAKLVEVDASVFKFTPKKLVLKVGEPVRFHVTSKDTIHTFTVTDLGIDVELQPGENKLSEVFTPQQSGTYQIICRIHSVSAYGMEGALVVTETGEDSR